MIEEWVSERERERLVERLHRQHVYICTCTCTSISICTYSSRTRTSRVAVVLSLRPHRSVWSVQPKCASFTTSRRHQRWSRKKSRVGYRHTRGVCSFCFRLVHAVPVCYRVKILAILNKVSYETESGVCSFVRNWLKKLRLEPDLRNRANL